MQKITLFFLAVMTTFVVSSCNKDKDIPSVVEPVSIVGFWKCGGIGVITDSKIVDATVAEIRNYRTDLGDVFDAQTFQFNVDGTSSIPKSPSFISQDPGKYKLSPDGKTLTVTSNTYKDRNGDINVQTFEVIKLTKTELILGIGNKLTTKDIDGGFVINTLTIDIITFFFGGYVFGSKGINFISEWQSAKTWQATYNLKR